MHVCNMCEKRTLIYSCEKGCKKLFDGKLVGDDGFSYNMNYLITLAEYERRLNLILRTDAKGF